MPPNQPRIHLAGLAGRSRDHIVSLLQGAITYLCLLRAAPPGSPEEAIPENTQGDENSDGKSALHEPNQAEVAGTVAEGSDTDPATTAKRGSAVDAIGSTTSPQASCGIIPAAIKPKSKRAAVLIWDSESLSSLLALHKAMAAALLKPERDALPESDPVSQSTKDSDPECRRRPRIRSTDVFKAAEASLATALAAAAAGAGSVASTNKYESSVEGEKNMMDSDRPPAPPDATGMPMLSGDHTWADSRLLKGCRPSSPRSIAGGGDGKPNNCVKQTGEATEPASELVGTGRSRFLNRLFPVPQHRAVVVSAVGRDTVVDLYAMRCTVREGLGTLEGALRDVQEALELAPKAPKLWAKAASLALRTRKHAEGGRGGAGGGDGGPRRAEMRRLAEVRKEATLLVLLFSPSTNVQHELLTLSTEKHFTIQVQNRGKPKQKDAYAKHNPLLSCACCSLFSTIGRTFQLDS